MNNVAELPKDIRTEFRVKPRHEDKGTHIVTQIPPNMVHTLWLEILPKLGPAIDRSHGRWTQEGVYAQLIDGHQQLWAAMDKDSNDIHGVMTTRVVNYPGKRMLVIEYLGGDNFNDWVYPMLDLCYDFGRQTACEGIEASARFGFWKWLEPEGFDRAYVVYEKSIDS